MTLSKKGRQTSSKSNSSSTRASILPVSFNYRLCPELNLIDGPITDVRDAHSNSSQPTITRSQDYIVVDLDRIVVIGWLVDGWFIWQ